MVVEQNQALFSVTWNFASTWPADVIGYFQIWQSTMCVRSRSQVDQLEAVVVQKVRWTVRTISGNSQLIRT